MTTELPSDMLKRLGMDGHLWAKEFRDTAIKLGYSDMDEGWLIGWFCNAVMAGFDEASRRAEKSPITPSAFKAVQEACAKVCDEQEETARPHAESDYTDADAWCASCAAAIRSLTPSSIPGLTVAGDEPDLRQFVAAIFDATEWPDGGDLDGFTFQDLAVKHGILTEQTRTAPCAEGCHCTEYYNDDEWSRGVTCYRKPEWLIEALTTAPGKEGR